MCWIWIKLESMSTQQTHGFTWSVWGRADGTPRLCYTLVGENRHCPTGCRWRWGSEGPRFRPGWQTQRRTRRLDSRQPYRAARLREPGPDKMTPSCGEKVELCEKCSWGYLTARALKHKIKQLKRVSKKKKQRKTKNLHISEAGTRNCSLLKTTVNVLSINESINWLLIDTILIKRVLIPETFRSKTQIKIRKHFNARLSSVCNGLDHLYERSLLSSLNMAIRSHEREAQTA